MTPTQQLSVTFFTYMASPTPRNFDALIDAIPPAIEAMDSAALANSRTTEGTASGVTVKVDRSRVWIVSGVQSFMLDYEADTSKELEWYASMLRGALAGVPATRVGAEPAPSMSMFATMDDYKQAKAEHAKRADGERVFTAIFRIPKSEAYDVATTLCAHPYWSAGSWSHALDDRDSARAALSQQQAGTPTPGGTKP